MGTFHVSDYMLENHDLFNLSKCNLDNNLIHFAYLLHRIVEVYSRRLQGEL